MKNPINHLLYRLKYRYADKLKLTIPVDVSLELASLCNQRCGYCYHAKQDALPFSKGLMSLDIAKLIIADAANLSVNSIKFNYRGEPTLNNNIYEIMSFAKEHATGSTFIDRIVNSNFKFLSEKEEIFKALCTLTKVKVSFDSFNPEVMETQREGSIHALAMKNIDIFYNHKDRKNTKLVIQAVRTLLNKDEDILGQAKKRWPEAEVSIRDMVVGRVDSDLRALEYRERDFSNRQSCLQANNRLIFDFNGNSQVCCNDIESKLVVGNINDSSIHEIFNSDKAKQIRKSLLDKSAFNLEPCKSCPSFESFKGYKHPWKS